MPSLDWIGKKAVVNHHRQVPYRLIHCDKDKSFGDPEAGNLLVQGDNLEALKALLPYYAGKVKCIYIDPPYNTGNESWVYNDNVNSPEMRDWLGKVVGKEAKDLSRHDKWLCMMYPRLRLLKEFLSEEGAVFVSLDDIEAGRFRLIADEIFGTKNFIHQCIWNKKYTRANDAKHFSDNHDHVIVYAKNKDKLIVHRLERTDKQDRAYTNQNNHPKGPWKPTPLHAKSGEDASFSFEFSNGVNWLPPEGTFPRFSRETLQALDRNHEIWFGNYGNAIPQRMSFLSEVSDGLVPVTLWPYSEVGHNHEANDELKEVGLSGKFQNPKPTRLIERCIELLCNDGDIVMDCFAGSGTTGHAALKFANKTNSKINFLLVEMVPEVATNVTAVRLARVVNGYDAQISSKQKIWEKTITLNEIAKGKDLLAKAESILTANLKNFQVVKIEFKDGKLSVVGETAAKKSRPGLGSGFRFCTLGEPLFDADGNVNAAVSFPDLAAHVFFCETGSPIPNRADPATPLIGTFQGRAIYLLHNADAVGVASDNAGNVLTGVRLDTLSLPEPGFSGARIVYGEGCTVPDDRLARLGVTFKQIPYQIEGL